MNIKALKQELAIKFTHMSYEDFQDLLREFCKMYDKKHLSPFSCRKTSIEFHQEYDDDCDDDF